MKLKYLFILFILIGCQSKDKKRESLSELMQKRLETPKPIDSVAAATSLAKYKKLAGQDKIASYNDTIKEAKDITYIIDYKPDSLLTFDADSCKAIFVLPDSLEIVNMKREYGEEDFHTIADDNNYYEYEANEFLKMRNIEYKSTDKRFVKLIKDSGQEIFIDTEQYEGSWGLIMFNGKDNPIMISLIDITHGWSELNLDE